VPSAGFTESRGISSGIWGLTLSLFFKKPILASRKKGNYLKTPSQKKLLDTP